MKAKMRESSFELLRIFCMFQVVFLHFMNHTNYLSLSQSVGGVHRLIALFLLLFNFSTTYVFYLLTGYFLAKKEMTFQDVKKRILKIYAPMLFFAIAIPIALVSVGVYHLDDVNIPGMFFPFLSKTWYFLSGYILVIAFSPFLNRFIRSTNKKEYRNLLLLLFGILCIWNQLASLEPFNQFIRTDYVFVNQGGKSLYNYLFLYLLGGYLSIYVKDKGKVEFKYLFIFLYCAIIQCVLIGLSKPYFAIATHNDNMFCVIQAVCLVLFVRNLKFKSKVINYISSYALAIYIIHEHYLMRNLIWKRVVILNKSFFSNWLYPFKALMICVIVFIGCILIEFLRRCLFKACSKLGTYISLRFSEQ